MIKPEQKKIAIYSFLILFVVGVCIHIYKTKKAIADRKNYIEKSLSESNIYDPELWILKDVSINEISNEVENQCQNLSVLFRIELKENCYENIEKTKNFWEKNIVIEKIYSIFKDENDKELAQIYKAGNCITEKNIDKSIEEERISEYKKIGTTVCLEQRHTVFGGGCKVEAVISKESIDEVISETKKSIMESLNTNPEKKKGYSIPMLYNAKYCKENGKKSLSLIKSKE